MATVAKRGIHIASTSPWSCSQFLDSRPGESGPSARLFIHPSPLEGVVGTNLEVSPPRPNPDPLPFKASIHCRPAGMGFSASTGVQRKGLTLLARVLIDPGAHLLFPGDETRSAYSVRDRPSLVARNRHVHLGAQPSTVASLGSYEVCVRSEREDQ